MGTTAFPGAADDFATTSPTNLGDDDSKGRTHSERHDDMESAMEAVQAFLLSGCSLTRTTNQTISADTATAISWDTEVWDTDGYWAVSPNPTRLVAPATGKYLLTGTVGSDDLDSTQDYQCNLWIDGSLTHYLTRIYPTQATETAWHQISVVVSLTAAQYVEVKVLQTSQAFSVSGGSGAPRTHIQMTRIG